MNMHPSLTCQTSELEVLRDVLNPWEQEFEEVGDCENSKQKLSLL